MPGSRQAHEKPPLFQYAKPEPGTIKNHQIIASKKKRKAMNETIDFMMCIEIKRFCSTSLSGVFFMRFQRFKAGMRTIKKEAPGRKSHHRIYSKKKEKRAAGTTILYG